MRLPGESVWIPASFETMPRLAGGQLRLGMRQLLLLWLVIIVTHHCDVLALPSPSPLAGRSSSATATAAGASRYHPSRRSLVSHGGSTVRRVAAALNDDDTTTTTEDPWKGQPQYSVKRFVVVTTARSGSGWLIRMLDSNPRIACRNAEPLGQVYSRSVTRTFGWWCWWYWC